MKKVSVIIPCYNAEKYLNRCLDSIVTQTIGIDNLEIIMLDDASTDRTWEMILEYESRYPESILAIHNDINCRQGKCREMGLMYATGEYVAYVDDDDFLDVTMYEKLYRTAKAYQCQMAECRVKRTRDGKVSAVGTETGGYFLELKNDAEREGFLMDKLQDMCIWCRLYEREWLLNTGADFPGGFLYEDEYFTALVMPHVERYCFIDEVLYYYFLHDESVSGKGSGGVREFDMMFVEPALLHRLKREGIYQRFPLFYEFRFLLKYYVEGLLKVFMHVEELNEDMLLKITAMQEYVRDMFPQYNKNPYLERKDMKIQKYILESVEWDFTLETLSSYQQEIMKIFWEAND